MPITTPTEVAIAEKIAANARQLLSLLADLDDLDTLTQKADLLDSAGAALYLQVIDTSDLPMTPEALMAAVRERLPEQLRTAVGRAQR
jgi:hypothetical protein